MLAKMCMPPDGMNYPANIQFNDYIITVTFSVHELGQNPIVVKLTALGGMTIASVTA